MQPRWLARLATALFCLAAWAGAASVGHAQNQELNRFYYYPYYYFPHNYWPSQGPKWPEQPGACYQRPPAYMAYPPFKEVGWYYEAFEPHLHHRGFHFWLDQF